MGAGTYSITCKACLQAGQVAYLNQDRISLSVMPGRGGMSACPHRLQTKVRSFMLSSFPLLRLHSSYDQDMHACRISREDSPIRPPTRDLDAHGTEMSCFLPLHDVERLLPGQASKTLAQV